MERWVGKTALSAILTKLLLQKKERLLLIDADPVVSLTYAVGMEPKSTIGDFREKLIELILEKPGKLQKNL